MEIKGTTALVTGGASGLGFATAARLTAAGARVHILDVSEERTSEAAALLGDSARWTVGDVLDTAAVSAALDAIAEERGALRIVVNCAGIGTPHKVLGRNGPFPLDLFRRTIDVNLVGTFNVIRLAAERITAEPLLGEERGVIISTASVAAFDGQIGQAAYTASKAGIAAMTLPVARELAEKQIRAMTLAPGIFQTPLLSSLPQDVRDSLGAQVPHPRRLGLPDEYAMLVEQVIVNPMLNGETIRIDGSIRMAPR